MSQHQPTSPLVLQPTGPARPASPLWIGWALAVFSVFCGSIAPPIARAVIASGLHPTAILFVRMALATSLLLITIGVTNPRLLRIDRRGMLIAVGAGLANSVGMMAYFWALTRLDASVASMIFSVSPLVVLSLLALRGEPITRRHIMRTGLALLGIYFLVGPGGHVDGIGVLLILMSVVGFALQLVIIQWYLRGYEARTVTFYILAGMTAGITVFWLAQGMPWSDPGRAGWLAILTFAVVSTYLARLSLFAAVSRIGGAQVALLTPLEVLMTVLWSILFLGEWLSGLQWVGGLLILASAALAIQRLGRVRVPMRWRLWLRP